MSKQYKYFIKEGTLVSWDASADGYVSQSGSLIMPDRDESLNIDLVPISEDYSEYLFAIEVDPSILTNIVVDGRPCTIDDYDIGLGESMYRYRCVMINGSYYSGSDAEPLIKRYTSYSPVMGITRDDVKDSIYDQLQPPESYVVPQGSYGTNKLNMRVTKHYDDGFTTNAWADGARYIRKVLIFNAEKFTSLNGRFSGYSSTTSISNIINTGHITSMSSMFSGCSSITEAPAMDTSSVTNVSNMFNGCSSLIHVPKYDFSKVVVYGTEYMFSECVNLRDLDGFTGLKTSLNLTASKFITVQSVWNIINEAGIGNGNMAIGVHRTVYLQLPDELKEAATKKGWKIIPHSNYDDE